MTEYQEKHEYLSESPGEIKYLEDVPQADSNTKGNETLRRQDVCQAADHVKHALVLRYQKQRQKEL